MAPSCLPSPGLGGLTVRAPQLPEPRRGRLWLGTTVLWAPPVTLTQVHAGPHYEVTGKGKKCSQNSSDGVGNSEKLERPPAFPVFPHHRPDWSPGRSMQDAGRRAVWWEGRGGHCPLGAPALRASMGGAVRQPRGCWESQRLLEVGTGFEGRPVPEKPALWLGPNVAAGLGAAGGGGRQEQCGVAAHTFSSSPAPHALASCVEPL